MNDYNLLKRLCLAGGISGDEGAVRKIITDEIKDYADKITIDSLGNLIVYKKGKKPSVNTLMISAHMDEVGFIVTDITDRGLIKFDSVGGINRRVVPGCSVVINNSVKGVVGVKPVHLCSSEEKKEIPKYEQMYIDIGAQSKQEAQGAASLGDSIVFEGIYRENYSTVMSKAIDDRAGCCIMIEMIKRDLEYDMYFTFVVQEEVGLRGSRTAAYTVNPQFALVLEATTAADIPTAPSEKQICSVGKGAVIGYMDRAAIYDKGLISHAVNTAEKNNIKIQFKRGIAGGNDAGAIHTVRGGVRTLAISLPCRYLHSQLSLIAKHDMEAVSSLANALAADIAGGRV